MSDTIEKGVEPLEDTKAPTDGATNKQLEKLSAKFAPEDIEWRIQSSGTNKNGIWAMAIAYVTNRAIQQRLDDVVGQANWRDEYKASPCNTGYVCGISIKIKGEWVTKWDGAEFTSNGAVDPVKSTLSNSEKRAGVKWGIGRYLYDLPNTFVVCQPVEYQSQAPSGWNFQRKSNKCPAFAWENPPLPDWAMPQEDSQQYIDALKGSQTLDELKHYFGQAYNLARSENDLALMEMVTSLKDDQKKWIEEKDEAEQQRRVDTFGAWCDAKVGILADVEIEAAYNALLKSVKQDMTQKALEFKIPLKEAEVIFNEKLSK